MSTTESQDTDVPTRTATLPLDSFREFIYPLAVLSSDCRVFLSDEGLTAKTVDPANVALCEPELSPSAFDDLDSPGESTIGMKVRKIAQVLFPADLQFHTHVPPIREEFEFDADTVTLTYHENRQNLTIEIGRQKFTLACIDPASVRKASEIPEMDLNAEVSLPGRLLRNGIVYSDHFADHIRAKYDVAQRRFSLEAEGATDDSDWGVTEPEAIVIRSQGDADSLYSADYCMDLAACLPDDREVRVEIGEEFPMKLTYEIADGAGEVCLMQAPRISSE